MIMIFKNILDELPSGVWATDSEDNIIYMNKAMTAIAGASIEEFTGLNVFKDLDKPGNKEFLDSYRKVKRNLFPGEYEVRLKDSKGKGFVHRGWLTPLTKGGKYCGMIVTAEDITEKDIYLKAMTESEDKFRRTIEFAADGILLGSNEGYITEANQAACELFGMSKEKMLKLHISKMPFTKESLEISPMRFDLLKQGKTVISERVIKRKDGSEIMIEMKTKMMDDGSYQSIYRDITERKKIEQELKNNEEKYSRLVHNINDGIGIVDSNENFTFVNKSAERIFEVEEGGLENKSLWDFITEENRKKILSETSKRQSGQSSRYEIEIITGKGNRKTIHVAASPDNDENGNISGTYGVFFDITEKKRIENALKENEEKFRTLFEVSNDAIYLMDGDTFIDCNEQAVKMFECADRREMIDHKPMEFSPPVQPDGADSVSSALKHINEALSGKPQRFYWKHRKQTGIDFDAEVSLNKVVLKGKKFLQAIVRDITFRMEAEKEIKRINESLEQKIKERTAELEEAYKELESFSYSVSHDLRAPLRHIYGFADILKKKIVSGNTENMDETLTRISSSAEKMERLIDDLLKLSRTSRQELNMSRTDFREITDEIISFYNDKKIKWIIPEFPVIRTDKNLINIVWQNLIDNSVKYTTNTKTPVIEIGYKERKGFNEFYIKDNGIGFDQSMAEKLFRPFSRLHLEKDFPGSGIGLAIVSRIIKRLGGDIRAEGDPGKGAAFYFSIPRVREEDR